MYLFDTNIFLEILLDQTEAESCQRALNRIDEIRPGWVTSYSIHAIESILARVRKDQEITVRFLQGLANNRLFFRYDTTLEEEAEIARLTQGLKLDFDDSLQYYVAKKEGLILVTLDRDFQKVSDIEVVSPKNL